MRRLTTDFRAVRKLEDLGRWHINRFVERVASGSPAGTRVLDAGAGEAAYKELFRHCRYVATDLGVGDASWNYGNLDSLSELQRLPFRSASFDAVLCTQVLEHVEWPRECVAEFFRILRPGGTLYLTVPMAQAEHQVPYDFFRYTSYGLRSILGGAGFRDVVVVPFGGLFTRFAYESTRILNVFPPAGLRSGRPRLAGIALLPLRLLTLGLIRIVQRLFLVLERCDREKNDPFGWSAVAKR
ncbi:MAG: class I SAM-dependent methyltransferase [Acidobacteriota bacterium]